MQASQLGRADAYAAKFNSIVKGIWNCSIAYTLLA